MRVKLSAKILFLFRISNKNYRFIEKALYPSRDIGLYNLHLLKRIIYRSLTSDDSYRDSGSEAPRSAEYDRGSTCC